MICDRVDDALTEVLDGTADPVLLNHADTCPRCRGLLADLRQVEDIVRAASADALGLADPAVRARAQVAAGRRRPDWRVGAGALAAAAFAAVIGGVAWTHRGPVDGAWHGTVEVRVGAGLTVCDPTCEPAGVGAVFGPGARIETDAFTRASLRLDDGSSLLVDRSSAVALDPRRVRAAQVTAGRVLADVAHLDGSHATLGLPDGEVTVLGTELVVGTLGALGEVTVTRGAVSVRSDRGQARVAAGETATLEAGRAPAVAQRTDWEGLPTLSELPGDTIRGIGELRARKPGASNEHASALRLARHHAKIRASGLVAVTEIEEVFANDSDDVLEGIFRFPLPAGASIESLGLEVDGELIQGAFVPRARARQIWTDVTTAKPQVRDDGILWYKDPALLEWQRGGRFELRIFPIPAHGSRRVVVRYSQIAPAVGDTRRMQVPLPSGGQPIDDFALDVAVVGHDPALGLQTSGYRLDGDGASDGGGAFTAERFTPTGDLVLAWALAERDAPTASWAFADPSPAPLPPGAPASLDPRDPFVAIAVHPTLPAGPSRRPDVVLVVDRSRSMVGERFARARTLAAEIVARLDEEQRARVLACDVTCDEMPAGPLTGGDDARTSVLAFLDGQAPDGGSDAVSSLARAGEVGAAFGRPFDVVWIGDGAPTVGPTRPATLEAAVAERAAGMRVFPVPIGADADTDAMTAVARASGGAVVPYVPGQRLDAAALTVVSATWSGVLGSLQVTAPAGVVAVVPPGRPVRAGEEVLVYARLRPGVSAVDGELVLSGTLDGGTWTRSAPLRIRASDHAGNAFVPRAYAAATIARLEAGGAAADAPEIEAWSTQYRVASRSTSLLVLESAAMFDAYGLARTSVAPSFDGEVAGTAEAGEEAQAAVGGGAPGGTLDLSGGEGMVMQLGYVAAGGIDGGDDGGGGGGYGGGGGGVSRSRDLRWSDPTWIPYKEVWIRHGSVHPPGFRGDAPAQAVAKARAAYVARGGRDAAQALVEALLVAGSFAEAGAIADTALDADPLDADLLRARSDATALQGDRDGALRILAGVADARPDAGWLLGWLQSGWAATGATALACDAAIARAELDPNDGLQRGAALGCADALGWHATTAALRAGYGGDPAAVEAGVASAGTPDVLSADVWIHASWSGGDDLDVSLIGPTGRRYGWLGPRDGDGRARVRGPVSVGDEAVSFAGLKRGAYRIQVSRVAQGGGRPIDGTLEVALPGGDVQRLPFHLDGDTTLGGWLDVRFTRETVILRGWSAFRWVDRGGWFP